MKEEVQHQSMVNFSTRETKESRNKPQSTPVFLSALNQQVGIGHNSEKNFQPLVPYQAKKGEKQ
jgi:hypothetical protein